MSTPAQSAAPPGSLRAETVVDSRRARVPPVNRGRLAI